MRPLRTLVVVAVVPTAIDIGLLVLLRQGLGWPLIVADLVGLSVASVASYQLHRITTFRAHPYFRWVRQPGAFVLVAAVAGLVDALVLRATFTAAGYTTVGGLLVAKAVAMSVAVPLRAIGYRYVLSDVVHERQHRIDQPPSDGSVRFSVVIPAYREEARIASTIAAVRAELADIDADGGLEIVVVDDGSGDGTTDAALAAGADQVVTLPRNRGKGAAVRAGMRSSRGRAVAFTDADLAYHPRHLRVLLGEIEQGWDVVIGNRRHPDSTGRIGGGLRAVGSRIVNRLAAIVLLATPLDTQSGLKGFRGDVARALFAVTRIDGFAFDIEVLHLVERREWSLHEIPVHLEDTGGGSTVRILNDVVRLTADLLRVRYWSSSGVYDEPSSSTSPAPVDQP